MIKRRERGTWSACFGNFVLDFGLDLEPLPFWVDMTGLHWRIGVVLMTRVESFPFLTYLPQRVFDGDIF